MRLLRSSVAAVAALTTAFPLALLGGAPAHAQSNGAAATPPMGWSSWSFIRKNPTEQNIEAQAKALSTSGLVAHGYSYVNIDDFWYLNPSNTVDGNGRWVTDPGRFPDGMGSVGGYVHALGEKFGMYLTPGIPVAAYNRNTPIEGTSFHAQDIVSDTSRYEANYNYGSGSMYFIDYAKNPAAAQAFLNSWANQLASYGVDYVKLDGVGDGDIPDVQHWSQALRQTGRPIALELSNALDVNNGQVWQANSNGWRIDGDVECYCSGTSYPLTDWNNVASRFNDVLPFVPFAGPGGWNDLDSLEIGNGSNTGLTPDERRTQATLWAVEGAPMLLGTDLTNLDPGDLALLTNDEVIAVDQAGRPARPTDRISQRQVWSTPNPDGSYTVALFNLGSGTQDVTARFTELGFSGAATVRDLWTHTDLGSSTASFQASLAPHASRLLRITPAAGAHPATVPYNLVNSATGQYLDVSGSNAVQQPADGASDQLWQLVPTGDGYYKLSNTGSGQVLAVPGSGSQLVQQPDDRAADSQWRLTPTGSGSYTVTARSDGQNADVSGSAVVQAAPGSGASQQWKLVPAPAAGTQYKLVDALTTGRLDVDNDSTGDGAGLVQWEDNGQADQRWTFNPQGGGSYTVVNANSGKQINVPGGTQTPGAGLIQYHEDGGLNSRWTLVDAGPNRLQLKSASDGQYVDVDHGYVGDGTTVLQWTYNGAGNQLWSLVPSS